MHKQIRLRIRHHAPEGGGTPRRSRFVQGRLPGEAEEFSQHRKLMTESRSRSLRLRLVKSASQTLRDSPTLFMT